MTFPYVAAFVAAFVISGTPVEAQMVCGTRADVVPYLSEEYGEKTVFLGLSRGQVIEILTNPSTGTFSIVTTRPDGTTCLIIVGEDWENIEILKGVPL